MKIIIKESQVRNLVLSFIGPLYKDKKGDFYSWKNQEGKDIFRTSDFNEIYANRGTLEELEQYFSFTLPDLYNILIDISKELIGTKPTRITLF